MSEDEKRDSIDLLIKTINNADPQVFVLMDYWNFDGWLLLQARLRETGAPELKKTVFPGIELRLACPSSYRLNAHVVFSNEIPKQDLSDFKAKLTVGIVDLPLSDNALIRLAREQAGEDKLQSIGEKKEEVDISEEVALRAGSKIAEIKDDTYKEAIRSVPNGNAVGFMAWDTSGGLSKTDWDKHYTYVIELMRSASIFETRNHKQRNAFCGIRTAENDKYFDDWSKALGDAPCLAVAGSDAHKYSDYGKFPSGKITWIKSDPTFMGLLQAIKEPANRSFIGECPTKLTMVNQNKRFFIDTLEILKEAGSSLDDKWLDGCNLELNPDLVAVIGNKGSGKSALADVIALLGNTKQVHHFSFLKNNRFRKGSNDYAKHFSGELSWVNPSFVQNLCLADNPDGDEPELVQYIPQNYFEELCNDHMSGDTEKFELELREVVFRGINQEDRQDALNFAQLIDNQEKYYRDQLAEHRKEMTKLNDTIEKAEAQLQPSIRTGYVKIRELKEQQILEHASNLPTVVTPPVGKQTDEERTANLRLGDITKELEAIAIGLDTTKENMSKLVSKERSIQAIREGIRVLGSKFLEIAENTRAEFEAIGLQLSDVIKVEIEETKINSIEEELIKEREVLLRGTEDFELQKKSLHKEQSSLEEKLNKPQKDYAKYQKNLAIWNDKKRALEGAPNEPETLKGIEESILQLDRLPTELTIMRQERAALVGHIFDVLDSQRKTREELFKPVQKLIDENENIGEEY